VPDPTPLACILEEILAPRSSINAHEVGNSVASNEVATETNLRPTTRSQHDIRRPKVYSDGTVYYGCFTSTGEPQNLEEALGSKNWKHAMDLEFLTLMNNKMWNLIPYEKDKNIIDCKWTYKIKKKT
jgi:hypothetical protein